MPSVVRDLKVHVAKEVLETLDVDRTTVLPSS